MFKKIIIAAVIIHIILLAYFLLFRNYFQQDEWHGFGIIFSQGINYITTGKSVFELLLGDRVGARILVFTLFNIFHLNPVPYGLFALIMQSLNVFLVFLLTKKLTKHTTIAFLASFLFLINELGNEAYSWFGTMTGTLTSTSFFLLSLITFLKSIDTKKTIFVLLSVFLLWLSFLFKEVGAFAFIFYPMLFLIYSPEKKKNQALIRSFLPFILLGTIILVFFAKTVLFIPGDRANYINTGKSFISTILIHSFQYPLEGIVQTIIPNEYLFKLSDITTGIIKPNSPHDSLEFLITVQNFGAEVSIIGLLIAAIIIMWILRKAIRDMPPQSKKTLLISVVMTALSFLPYIVINRSFSYMDSRYYYLGTVGTSIFLATLFVNFMQIKKQIVRFAVILIIIFYVFIHESVLLSDLKLVMDRSEERQDFLKQIEKLIPQLQKKTVFFVTGDSVGYYGIPELKTPFQSGLGHVLMVTYTVKKQLSPRFFDEETKIKLYDVGFLYDILGQGYRKINGQGFGYYYDRQELNKALKEKLFSEKDVISLYYESGNKKLIRKALLYEIQ